MKNIKKDILKYVLGTYTRKDIAFVSGKGSKLKTIDGKQILDFFPGWGVSNLGHCHKNVVKAICDQAKKIIHMANIFYIPDQADVAKGIIKKSFPGQVFFSNSGTESVECAIKTAKAWGKLKGKKEFISLNRSFHGRTIGSVTLTGQKAYREAFGSLMPNVKYADLNDIKSVEKIISKKTCAIIIELVQGEGGVRIANKKFVKELEKLSKKHQFLLIFDEVQTGFGRTSKFFAYQHYGVTPHIMCLGKAIAGGVAMGATVVNKNIASIMKPGMHASTFGGNYLACASAKAVLKTFEEEDILKNMKPVQKELESFFKKLSKKYSQIISFRSLGMMFGLEMEEGVALKIADTSLENGLIINCTAKNVLRIMPALNLSLKDCRKGMKIIEKVFKDVCR